MKILELLESVFVEAATADLYHGTSLHGLLKILETDVIKANMPIHSDQVPAAVKGQKYTVSLTRNRGVAQRFAWDASSRRNDVGVILIINQDQLRRDLGRRVRPYDDTSSNWYRSRAEIYHKQSLRPTDRSESEEVVYGDIPNANKYIKNIIILPTNREDILKKIEQSGILNDPRTRFDNAPKDYGEYRKERSDKYYLGKLGIK